VNSSRSSGDFELNLPDIHILAGDNGDRDFYGTDVIGHTTSWLPAGTPLRTKVPSGLVVVDNCVPKIITLAETGRPCSSTTCPCTLAFPLRMRAVGLLK